MGTRLTSKTIVAAALRELPNVSTIELVRCPGHDYYYVVGEFKNKVPFVSSGIYVCRLHGRLSV